MKVNKNTLLVLSMFILDLIIFIITYIEIPKISYSITAIVISIEVIIFSHILERKRWTVLLLSASMLITIICVIHVGVIINVNTDDAWRIMSSSANNISEQKKDIFTSPISKYLQPTEVEKYNNPFGFIEFRTGEIAGYKHAIKYDLTCVEIQKNVYRINIIYTRQGKEKANYNEYLDIVFSPSCKIYSDYNYLDIGDIYIQNFKKIGKDWYTRNGEFYYKNDKYVFKLDNDEGAIGYMAFNIYVNESIDRFSINIKLKQMTNFGKTYYNNSNCTIEI